MNVAIAIIKDKQERILITQRPLHVSHGGYWEFPGGKLEANETAEQALVREIKEEVGLDVLQYQFLGEITHHYPTKSVQLLIFHVTQYEGIPHCCEGQLNMKWMEKNEFNPVDFPDANHGIFELI